jgi:hypothetical protein
MRNFLRELLSVDWFTFVVLFTFYWFGLATVTWPWFCLPFVVWAGLWIWFADKPKK